MCIIYHEIVCGNAEGDRLEHNPIGSGICNYFHVYHFLMERRRHNGSEQGWDH